MDYPAYGDEVPPWSRGWDDEVGPSWEADTEAFPVIVVQEESPLARYGKLALKWLLGEWLSELIIRRQGW